MPGPIIKDPTPEWLKAKNASVLDPTVVKIARTLADILGITDPQSQVVGMMTPLVPEGQAMVSKPLQKAAGSLRDLAERVGIKAFHGSPHDFEKFSLSKIGTGEGAQAQGHGLYFGSQRDTADSYRNMLSARAGTDGRTYEVSINASPGDLLDWDAPINQQSQEVQQRLAPALEYLRGRPVNSQFAEKLADGSIKARQLYLILSGEKFLDHAQSVFPQSVAGLRPNKFGAEYLKDLGVPGAKYSDAGSWTAMKGQNMATGPSLPEQLTHNYVIWDDSLIDILKKYGVALPVIEGLRRKAAGNGGRLSSDDINGVF